ncbi:MAG: hypothetical protein ABIQ73_06985 [Acidimicrobiales bacterium]
MSGSTSEPVLLLPSDFDQYEWEVESKGYYVGACVELEGRRISITFYDQLRLGQDVEA